MAIVSLTYQPITYYFFHQANDIFFPLAHSQPSIYSALYIYIKATPEIYVLSSQFIGGMSSDGISALTEHQQQSASGISHRPLYLCAYVPGDAACRGRRGIWHLKSKFCFAVLFLYRAQIENNIDYQNCGLFLLLTSV